MDCKRWVQTSLMLHVVLLTMAAASYVMHLEFDRWARFVFLIPGVWLLYLLYSKGPRVSVGEVPNLLRYYYWAVAILMFLFFNIVLFCGHELPGTPFRLSLFGVLVPFAIIFRMKAR